MYPSYFKLKESSNLDKPKSVILNHSFCIEFETNAPNDYLTRDRYLISFELRVYNGDVLCDTIQRVTRAISPILLPMITTLNEIEN